VQNYLQLGSALPAHASGSTAFSPKPMTTPTNRSRSSRRLRTSTSMTTTSLNVIASRSPRTMHELSSRVCPSRPPTSIQPVPRQRHSCPQIPPSSCSLKDYSRLLSLHPTNGSSKIMATTDSRVSTTRFEMASAHSHGTAVGCRLAPSCLSGIAQEKPRTSAYQRCHRCDENR
jgi:hypothetical protein